MFLIWYQESTPHYDIYIVIWKRCTVMLSYALQPSNSKVWSEKNLHLGGSKPPSSKPPRTHCLSPWLTFSQSIPLSFHLGFHDLFWPFLKFYFHSPIFTLSKSKSLTELFNCFHLLPSDVLRCAAVHFNPRQFPTNTSSNSTTATQMIPCSNVWSYKMQTLKNVQVLREEWNV